MIIWINGAFGSGKTHTAYELNKRLPNSYIYDPEEVGFFISDNLPDKTKLNDFQDYPMWRDFNYKMLAYINDTYDGIIIVPMTITNEIYFKEIISKMRQNNLDIRHFTLMAKKETLIKRLKKRGDGKNSWPVKQIDRCLDNLTNEIYAEHISTDNIKIETVAEKIATKCGVKLLPDNRGWLTKKKDRLLVTLRHIRLLK